MVMPRAMGRPWDKTFPRNFMIRHPRIIAWDTCKLPRNDPDGQAQSPLRLEPIQPLECHSSPVPNGCPHGAQFHRVFGPFTALYGAKRCFYLGQSSQQFRRQIGGEVANHSVPEVVEV